MARPKSQDGAQIEIPEGMICLQAPEGSGGAGFNGVDYPSVEGFVIVTAEAVSALKSHGFTEA